MIIKRKDTKKKIKFIPVTPKNTDKYNSMKNNKILISNLYYHITVDDIKVLFEDIGNIYSINISYNTGVSSALDEAIVIFTNSDSANEAINK